MFSIDAAEGLMERRDSNNLRRVDIAKAFDQFRKENPYATAEELESYAQSMTGSDFFLMPENATGKALDTIAATHATNRQVRDRKQQIDALGQDRQLGQEIESYFTDQFKISGDVKKAFEQTKSMFGEDVPGDPAMSAQLGNFLGNLDKKKDALATNIIYAGLGENDAQLKGMVESGMDFETLSGSMPVYLQTEQGQNLLKGRFDQYDRTLRGNVFTDIQRFMTEPGMMEAIGMGDLSLLKERLGSSYDRYNQDGYLDGQIRSIYDSTRQNNWDKTRKAETTAAFARGKTELESAIARQTAAFAGYAVRDEDKYASQNNALNRLNSMYVITPQAYPAIMDILDTDTGGTSQEQYDKMTAAAPPGSLIDQSTYSNESAKNYLNLLGVGDNKPHTFLEWSDMNLANGDGAIFNKVKRNVASTANVRDNTTTEIYGKTNKFGIVTAAQYGQHVNDLALAISQQMQDLEDLKDVRLTIRNQSNFLADFGRRNGERVDIPGEKQLADQQIYSQMEEIQKNIDVLTEKAREVREKQAIVQAKNRPFADYDSKEINEAANAMKNYASAFRQKLDMNLAMRYAAMMGVRGGGTMTRQDRRTSQDQKELAEALYNAAQ